MGPAGVRALLGLLCLACCPWHAAALLLLLRNNTGSAARSGAAVPAARNASAARNSSSGNSSSPSFPQYVEGVQSGWGIWKWSNALAAYDRHLHIWKEQPVRLAEVGVWSGGSLLMWPAVLGPQCWVYGLDISQDALSFQAAPNTQIVLLDQGDPKQWEHFFTHVTSYLNVLIDDGGHTSPLMLTTTYSAWPHISEGGVLAIEDIHGPQYLSSFFQPVAQYYGGQARSQLASLHIYPFVLLAQKAASWSPRFDPSVWPGAIVHMAGQVSSFEQLTVAITTAPPGCVIKMENAAWGDFLSASAIDYVFQYFNGLHTPAQMLDSPAGCAHTNTAVCSSYVVNSHMMNKVLAVHILPTSLVVEIPTAPPVIQAVRHGDSWKKYPTHS
jgi:hypothetical protein